MRQLLRSVGHWLLPLFVAFVVITPFSLGVVSHERSIDRRRETCVAIVQIDNALNGWKAYLKPFVTDATGQKVIVGLPVPSKPSNC